MFKKNKKTFFTIISIISFIGIASFVSFGLSQSQSSQTLDIDKGLVGYWRLNKDDYDSDNERVRDSSGYKNYGQNYGATFTSNRYNKTDSAMSFNNDYINLGNDDIFNITEEITLSAWIKLDPYQGQDYHTIFWKTYNNNSGGSSSYGLSMYPGRKLRFALNSYQLISPNIIEVGKWYHITGTYDGQTMKLYENGNLVASRGKSNNILVSTQDVTIGVRKYGSSLAYRFYGSISDAKINNKALSEDEVKALYESYETRTHVSSLQEGLVAHWSMDEDDYNSTTQRVSDKSPYENHGVNNGATFTTDRFGEEGGTMIFNGVTDYIDTGTSVIPKKDFSISLWFNAYSTPGFYHSFIGQYGSGANGRFWFGLQDGRVGYRIGNRNALAGPVSTNVTRHATLTRKGSSVKIYLDGSLVSTSSAEDDIYQLSNTLLGSFTTRSGLFNGSVDDVRIYDRVLSESEIESLYDSYEPKTQISSLQKGLILDMPLTSDFTKTETPGSEIITDRTPYSNDGQNYGAVITEDGAIFDGNSEILTKPSVELSEANGVDNPFSFTFWAKATAKRGAYDGFINLRNSGNQHDGITLSRASDESQRIRYWQDGGTNITWTNNNMSDWNLYSVVASDNFITVYLNGDVVASTSFVNPFSFNGVIDIGQYLWSNNYLIGQISNLRVYDRVLSEKEVIKLYDKGRLNNDLMFN